MRRLFQFDRKFSAFELVAGVDEAGRGPLAGPVVSAAVILYKGTVIRDLDDSKKLTPSLRDLVYKEIISKCRDYKVGIVDNYTIDRINILQATRLSMKMAVERLTPQPEMILVDGQFGIDTDFPQTNIVNGDSKSASIAAASVVAKVTRDALMVKYDAQYPGYGFAKHKGYGTKLHIDAIRNFGPCKIHRKTFAPVREQ